MAEVYQFSGVLLPLTDSRWNDDDVPLEQRGIEARFFSQFYEKVLDYRGWVQRTHDLSFSRDEVPDPPDWNWSMNEQMIGRYLVKDHIVPLTEPIAAPLFARIPEASRGKPNVFLSYSWDAPLLANGWGVIEAVTPHLKAGDFVWADVFCHNQHRIGSVAPQMKKVIAGVKRLLVPMSAPTWYERCWCIWEVLCAFQNNVEVVFVEYARKARDMYLLRDTFLSEFHSMMLAETSFEEDKALIVKEARETFGSIEATDRYFRSKMNEVFATSPDPASPGAVTNMRMTTAQKYAAFKFKYEALKKIFSDRGPPIDASLLNKILWHLHFDPDPAASVTMKYEKSPHYDAEFTFGKRADGITSTLGMTDKAEGLPGQVTVTRYWLVDELWQSEVLQDWQRS
jgi:hypothetical protein